jgi:hypothetical protein
MTADDGSSIAINARRLDRAMGNSKDLTPQFLADHILALLPRDGAPVVNRVMRSTLSRNLKTIIDGDAYFQALELLSSTSKITRARGRGGSIFLNDSPPENASAPSVEETGRWTEQELMLPVKRYLEDHFIDYLDLPAGAETVVTDSSTLGPREGQWARPDFLLVSVMKFKLVPGIQLDVHSFELKASYGGSIQAIHEALAQTRFTNFGHFIWHVPIGSIYEARVPELEGQCEQHGLGFIIIRDPEVPDTWEVRLDPKQKATPAARVDAFLEARLPAAHQARIRSAVLGD